MELSQEEAMPIPINSRYGGGGQGDGHGHMIHHHLQPNNHIDPSSAPQIPSNGLLPTTKEDHVPYKIVVRYRECLKNHAAAMGGDATDGCGEFMPSGEEGTIEALTCSACNCHRNFHRKEIEGEPPFFVGYHSPNSNRAGRKVILGHQRCILGPETLEYPTPTGHIVPSRAALPHQMMISYNMGFLPSESDEQEDGGGGGGSGGFVPRAPQVMKKRFRTKFTQEQKEKMLNLAEKVGWKMQKQDEALVQQFCQEVGVKRRVLKVWMHNNKHNLAKKNNNSTAQNQV